MASTIPLFYEPGAPPLPLPLLTCQAEVYFDTIQPSTLISQEELPPFVASDQAASSRRHRSLPSPTKPPAVRFRSQTPFDDDSASQKSESSLSSLSDSEESASSDSDGKIRKPVGEVGRPGRGGYNLQVALSWSSKEYRKLKKFVDDQVQRHCDISQSYKYQLPAALKKVRVATAEAFPRLTEYDGCWPVGDMTLLRLKNTSAKHRRDQRAQAGLEAAEQVKHIKKQQRLARKASVKS